VALQLLDAGYTKVSVVRGGWQQLIEAGIAATPKAPPTAALTAGAPSPSEQAQSGTRAAGMTMPPIPHARESV